MEVASVKVAVDGDGRGEYSDERTDEEGDGTGKKIDVASV
jgi:hypothetical protein